MGLILKPEPSLTFIFEARNPNLPNESRYAQLWGIKNVVCGCSCSYTILSHPK